MDRADSHSYGATGMADEIAANGATVVSGVIVANGATAATGETPGIDHAVKPITGAIAAIAIQGRDTADTAIFGFRLQPS